MPQKLKFFKKACFIISLAISILILFELALFISGRFMLMQRRGRPGQGNIFQIICVGDSHTFGVGTSAQYSYPAQLERLLNLNNNSLKFSVVNLGIPGSSTRIQVIELTKFLRNNQASMVIMLTGRNNDLEIKEIKESSFLSKAVFYLKNRRVTKFFSVLINSVFKNSNPDKNADSVYRKNYIELYLNEVKQLCLKNKAPLVLLSYYNGPDSIVKGFAEKNNILFLDPTKDFSSLFGAKGLNGFLSPDMSHLNRFGYRFFSERLYSDLFANRQRLGMELVPLLKKIDDNEFYAKDTDIESALLKQTRRVLEKNNTGDYPYELIHLGHIYSEIANLDAARDCYLGGLVSSGYADDNTLTQPIINWYLENKGKEETIAICEDILLHNPDNRTAKIYSDKLK